MVEGAELPDFVRRTIYGEITLEEKRAALAAPREAAARMSTQPTTTTPHPYESFLSGTSANYVDDMYEAWQQDPAQQRREKWPCP